MRSRLLVFLVAIAVCVALAACAASSRRRRADGGTLPPLDAGSTMTDGSVDTGPSGLDAALPDAGRTDAGRLDAGSRDAGPRDAGPRDAGPRDAGPRDAGPRDSGPSGSVDYPVGGRDLDWTTSRYWRGNVYEAYRSTTLRRFSSYLGLASPCTLGFYVFTSTSATGPFTRVWSASVTTSGTGYHASGPIELPVTAGTFYALGVGWDCSATYYSATYETMTGRDGGVGYLRANAWSNSYPGYSLAFTPANAGLGGAHYDQIVTVSP